MLLTDLFVPVIVTVIVIVTLVHVPTLEDVVGAAAHHDFCTVGTVC